jgi:putative peptidoglycan lipid II flippase
MWTLTPDERPGPPVATTGSLVRSAGAVMLGAIMGTAGPVLEKLMAVTLEAGAASYLEYAYRLLAIPAVLFDGALAPLLLARWSQAVATGGRLPAGAEIWRPVVRGLGLAAAIGLTTALLAPGLVAVLLLHGRFRPEDGASVTRLLQGLSLGFVATMGALLLERFYIAATRTGTIATYSSLRAAVRVLVALALLRRLGLLAFVIGYAVAEWGYLAALAARVRAPLAAEPGVVPGSPETA